MQFSKILNLNSIVLFIRIGGFVFAMITLMQYYTGKNELNVDNGAILVHGIDLVRIFVSFLIIAFGSLVESIWKICGERILQMIRTMKASK